MIFSRCFWRRWSFNIGTKLELPVLVAAFYGLWRGEVCGLKWDAIDFERGTLTVKRTVTSIQLNGKTQMIEQESAKTKSSMRTLPLVGSFKEYFQKVKEAQALNKKVCGNCYNYEYDGFVFVDEMGDLLRSDYLTTQFPAFIQRHGMKKMRFHDLHHPYVKPTTKNIFCKSRNSKPSNVMAWDSCFSTSELCRKQLSILHRSQRFHFVHLDDSDRVVYSR